MIKGSETRGNAADIASGSGQAGFQSGSNEVDVSQIAETRAAGSQQQQGANQQAAYVPFMPESQAPQVDQAAIDAGRRREKDEDIRDSELEKQQSERKADGRSRRDDSKASKRVSEEQKPSQNAETGFSAEEILGPGAKPVEGYDNLFDVNGRLYLRTGEDKFEMINAQQFIDEFDENYDRQLFADAGHSDLDWEAEERRRQEDQEYWENKLQEELALYGAPLEHGLGPRRSQIDSSQNSDRGYWEEVHNSPWTGTVANSLAHDAAKLHLGMEPGIASSASTGPVNNQQAPAQQQNETKEQTPREAADSFFRDYHAYRTSEARKTNRNAREAWQALNPGRPLEEYFSSDDYVDDPEAFERTLRSLMSEHYPKLNETETVEELDPETGELVRRQVPRKDTGFGEDFQERERQDRLIDSVVHAFKIGFFHIATEHVDVDEKTGERTLGWGRRPEAWIGRICDYLGMDKTQVDSQRTVFRLVILYASMGVDRNGKMFNQDKDEWSLTEDEFCSICDMIYRSCKEHGNPLVAPSYTSAGRSRLRGTDVIPSGVMPKVVAKAITGPDSQLCVNGTGEKITAGELIRTCREEWVARTYPWMKANLTDENGPAQRITIEDMQQGLARIDGMDADKFSKRYNVDTTFHAKLREYQDTHVDYATATNNLYDADKVTEYQNALLAEIEKKAQDGHMRETGAVAAAANIVTSGIKTNALFWNVPIAMSAILEKGVGDVQTDFAIRTLARGAKKRGIPSMDVSQELKDAFKTDEAHKAIDAALIIMDVAGPEGLLLFSKEKKPLTQENAFSFLQEKILPKSKGGKLKNLERRLSMIQQKILTGDVAFKNKDAMNFLNAILVSNQILIDVQQQLAANGEIDEHAGMALNGQELSDIFLGNNGDITMFLSEIFGTAAGRDALMMMRSNNIGNFNPIGYRVDKFLRDHAVTNAMITTFFDSFPKYGINFLYTITPFSRTLTYLAMKRREAHGDMTAGMKTIGGGLADVSDKETFAEALNDPAFRAGLRMNLAYDAMTFGRWSVTALVLGGVMAALGFEPPDDPNDINNVSKWKIGGVEVQLAYWLNDLTQLGLPAAYGFAAFLSGQDPATCAKLALDSLYDQVDGNVVIDFIEGVKGWGEELGELERMASDPTYEGKGFNLSYGIMELILSAGDKIVPGAPLYSYMKNNAFWRGDYARTPDPYKEYDKSSEWTREVGKTNYIDDPLERQVRKHATSNWLLALGYDFANGILADPEGSEKTSAFWWNMPPKTKPDELALTWAATQEMDYTNREGCATDQAYEELKTDQLLKQIDTVIEDYGGIHQAVMNGYIITHDVRYAALNVLSDRLIQNEAEFQAMKDSGALASSDDFYAALDQKKAIDNEIWDYINILKDDSIPMWSEGYEMILTDRDLTYKHSDGTPAMAWEYLFSSDVTPEWENSNKGNHPWAMLPFTVVDKTSNSIVQRGFSGETVPYWHIEGEDGGTNLEAIRNGIGREVVPSGRNKGYVLNDVLFGFNDDLEKPFDLPMDEDSRAALNAVLDAMDIGSYLHPDTPTVDERSWVPKDTKITDDIKNYDVTGKVKAATGDKDDDSSGSDNKSNYGNKSYPKSYSGNVYSRSSSNYNPKIYSTRISSTHVPSTHISNTRTDPDSRSVNADRAATMYAKTPQDTRVNTYLRPGFETKGSREAYKRQDI